MLSLPSLDQVLANNVDWLLTAVTTEEAAELLSIPAPTLVTWRSRKSDGPSFVRIRNTRLVRYLRIELYRWLLADGQRSHNNGPGSPIALPLPTGKPVGSCADQRAATSGDLAQRLAGGETIAESGRINHPQPSSRSGPSNSLRKGFRGRRK